MHENLSCPDFCICLSFDKFTGENALESYVLAYDDITKKLGHTYSYMMDVVTPTEGSRILIVS